MQPNNTTHPFFVRLSVLIACLALIAGGVLYYEYRFGALNPEVRAREAIHQLVQQHDSAALHALAHSDPAAVGHSTWVLANLYVADESFLSNELDSAADTRTQSQITADDAQGLSAAATVLSLKGPYTQEDALAWVVFAEKLRRLYYGSSYISAILSSNDALKTEYDAALPRFAASSTIAQQGALTYVVGVHLADLYSAIKNDPAYSVGLKEELKQEVAWSVFAYAPTTSDAAILAFRQKIGAFFYSALPLTPDTLSGIPEFDTLGEAYYFAAIYSVQRVWNIDQIYSWQRAHVAGTDFPANQTISYAFLEKGHLATIAMLDAAAKAAGSKGEFWTNMANGVRISLVGETIATPSLDHALAVGIVSDAMAPIISLYQTDPGARFFQYLKSIGGSSSTAKMREFFTAAGNEPAIQLAAALGW